MVGGVTLRGTPSTISMPGQVTRAKSTLRGTFGVQFCTFPLQKPSFTVFPRRGCLWILGYNFTSATDCSVDATHQQRFRSICYEIRSYRELMSAKSKNATHLGAIFGGGLAGERTPCSRARIHRRSDAALAALPGAHPRSLASLVVFETLNHRGDHGGDRSELRRCGVTCHDRELGRRRRRGVIHGIARGALRCHRGMFPCFLGGRLARFVRRALSAFTTTTRVAAGSITPSSSPRSAARNGDATL